MIPVLTRLITLSLLAALVGPLFVEAARAEPDEQPVNEVGPPLAADQPLPEAEPCTEPGSSQKALVDRVQRGIYTTVCGAAMWFDGLFGNLRYEQDTDETFGRIGLFETYDRRDRFDTRLRLRARYAFPAMKQSVRLTLGRGNEQALVEERPATTENPLPASFQSVDDDAWLLGLGYSKQSDIEKGFDFGVGVRLRSRLDPYVKGTYRYNWVFDNENMLRFRETPFWRDTRGFGTTTQVTLDRLVGPELLLRWNNAATIAEDTKGFEWGSNVSAYKSFDRGKAISYTALVRGETSAEVPIQNYGVETRYRQRMFRKWLFLELSGSLTWPRELRVEERKINPGVGLGVEMYFGPVPELEMR